MQASFPISNCFSSVSPGRSCNNAIRSLVMGYFRSGEIKFDGLYFHYKEIVKNNLMQMFGDRATPEKLEAGAAEEVVTIMLDCAAELCFIYEDYAPTLCSQHSGLGRATEDFIDAYGLGVSRVLKKYIHADSYELRSLIEDLIRERNAKIDGVRGLMDLLNQSMRR